MAALISSACGFVSLMIYETTKHRSCTYLSTTRTRTLTHYISPVHRHAPRPLPLPQHLSRPPPPSHSHPLSQTNRPPQPTTPHVTSSSIHPTPPPPPLSKSNPNHQTRLRQARPELRPQHAPTPPDTARRVGLDWRRWCRAGMVFTSWC